MFLINIIKNEVQPFVSQNNPSLLINVMYTLRKERIDERA